ncbi:immune inhibitor A domain-containing protein [Shewanella maritima]|uniref:immune inhibitor A domain-containing protein n=1 Tax=Shewanella maritima TaxID=2520507 RepID=UPI0037360B86
MKQKLLSTLVGSALVFASASQAQTVSGTPADPGVINKEQVLYWLKKRGELAPDATLEQQQDAVNQFVSKSQEGGFEKNAMEFRAQKLHSQQQAQKLSGVKSSVSVMNTMADEDVTKTVKVLGVLVDFPDLLHDDNGLSASDTSMYYPNYPVSHYQDLLFSTSGFTGPQSQTLQSTYQYFQAASGQSFFFTGEAQDWVTADNNAAYYGGNGADDNDSNVSELVIEAVIKAVASMSDTELASYDIEDPYDLDGDGNLDEPDGMIDHIMLFHSSIGEEAGGGNLGADAIWSHRYFVNAGQSGHDIPGRNMQIFGYTIQPIDAAAGVCAHEFGHDLGLPDEYDTNTSSEDGSPVGSWSIMSSGSWAGQIPGTQPTGFSPYARSFLQDKFKGKWVNEQLISLGSINSSGVDVSLNYAADSESVNQLSIELPPTTVAFKTPFEGEYQYYSGQGDMLDNRLSFDVDVPNSASVSLDMIAHWDIEVDYDYMQVLVNGVAIAGNQTRSSNSLYPGVQHFITGASSDLASASGPDSWVTLSYDLAAYAGQSVTISFAYITDQSVGGYGMAIDNISIMNNGSAVFQDGAEQADSVTLSGFSRIDDQRPAGARRYIVQLRNYQGIDQGLEYEGYEPGVLIWLENLGEYDNNVSQHAGSGLIGVVDADQNLIGSSDTSRQIRDAAFSLFDQSAFFNDNHLSAVTMFDDSLDYSAPLQPQSGLELPELGLTMEVISQATNSSTATVQFKRSGSVVIEPDELSLSLVVSVDGSTASFDANAFGGDGNYTYLWDFGVAGASSAEAAPIYSFSESGDYQVTVTVTDGNGDTVTASQDVRIAIPPQVGFNFSANNLDVSFTSQVSDGFGQLTFMWDFGDNSNSSAQNATHSYAQSGTYTVSLTVTDELGNSQTASQSVQVEAAEVTPPVVTPEPSSGDSGGSLGMLSLLALGLLLRGRAQS